MIGDSRSPRGTRWPLRAISALGAVARFHLWQPGRQRVFRPLPDAMPGVIGDGVLRTSIDGLRADAIEASQEYRLLAIGASTEALAEGIDLATRLLKNDSIFYDDMHFNEGGSQEVARLISTYMLSPEAPPLRR
jgi:hypothetical protein